jgi:hypothetical protein
VNIKTCIRNGLLLLLGIVAILFVGRRLWFYRGSYTAPDIPEIDDGQIAPSLTAYQPFEDEPLTGDGHVIIDLAHSNNLAINDLSPLRDRLEARGATIETFDGDGDPLATRLRNATALLVIAPTVKVTAEERETIMDFVADGGRLLLAADPTRPVPEEEEEEEFPTLYSIFFPTSAVPAINSLASAFGVVYFDDYVYNLDDNAGNYRNVKFTTFGDEHPLTKDIETLVFFSTHSLRSSGLSLVAGDAHTHSPVRSGETDLTVAALAADERVLALGDVTFLTSPYHTVGDNDRFLSHIADWLAVDTRERKDLEDFPYLFERPVDLIQVSGDLIDPRLIARGSELQAFFEQADLTLDVRAAIEPGHDALYVGVFDDMELVYDYLTTAGVTVTVGANGPARPSADEETEVEETVESESEAGTPTAVPATPSPQKEESEEEAGGPGIIGIEALGSIGTQGSTLFLIDHSDDRVAVIVLAEDSEAVIAAIERLTTNDLSGCIQANTVTICSTGEVQDELDVKTDEPDDEDDKPADESDSGGRIFILSDDDKSDGTRTSAAEFEAILSESYAVTVWSIARDGVPTSDDLAGYGAYIVDSGDYAFDIEKADALTALENIDSGGVMFIGTQPLPFLGTDYEPINDLQVVDASHPLAAGFASDEVLTLLASESGIPAAVILDADMGDEAQIILARGPDSPNPGTPALVAAVDETDDISHYIIAAFAFYRLPEDTQRTLALNAVKWLLESNGS